jgi:hypothetical protein
MKSIQCLVLVSFIFGLSACLETKSEYKAPEVKIDQKFDDILKSMKKGGQPGQIILNGVVVNLDGTLDQRISVEQVVGTSAEKTEILEGNLPKLNPDLKRKDDYRPSKHETYLNVGCDLTDDPRIAGMTEEKNKPNDDGTVDIFGAAASMVDKIFICGKTESDRTMEVLNANEIYLNNAEILMKTPLGGIYIITDFLSIEGKNLISSSVEASSISSSLQASNIQLNIYEKFVGNGDLALKSVGGNYVKNEQK